MLKQKLGAPSQFPLYIFDLDGTMALIDHRRHLVEPPMVEVERNYRLQKGQYSEIRDDAMYIRDPNFKPDWAQFYALCVKDIPNWPVIGTFLQLYGVGADLRIWSGRGSEVRGQTLEWLCTFLGMQPHAIDQILKMRPEGDHTSDVELKKKWLEKLTPQERGRLTASFDDRQKVVDMWRANGVACFQVAPGDF